MLSFLIEESTRFRGCTNTGGITCPWEGPWSLDRKYIQYVLLQSYYIISNKMSIAHGRSVGSAALGWAQLVLLVCCRLPRQLLIRTRVTHVGDQPAAADLGLPWPAWVGQPDVAPAVLPCSKSAEERATATVTSKTIPIAQTLFQLCYNTFANILLVKVSHMAQLQNGRSKLDLKKGRDPGRKPLQWVLRIDMHWVTRGAVLSQAGGVRKQVSRVKIRNSK